MAILAIPDGLTFTDTGYSVDPSWQFDSSTKIYLCADTTGAPTFDCTIHAFTYWFTNPTDIASFMGPIIRNDFLKENICYNK